MTSPFSDSSSSDEEDSSSFEPPSALPLQKRTEADVPPTSPQKPPFNDALIPLSADDKLCRKTAAETTEILGQFEALNCRPKDEVRPFKGIEGKFEEKGFSLVWFCLQLQYYNSSSLIVCFF